MDMLSNLISSVRSSGSQTVQIDNPPRLPSLRLVLTFPDQPSSQASSNNHSLQAAVNFLSETEKAEILENLNRRGHLTEKEMYFLNKRMKESLDRTMSSFIEDIIKLLKIRAGDSLETAAMKEKLLREVSEGLKQLFKWVLVNLEKVMKIEDPKSRNNAINNLFVVMESSLSDCIGTGSMPRKNVQKEQPKKQRRKEGMNEDSRNTVDYKPQEPQAGVEQLAIKLTCSGRKTTEATPTSEDDNELSVPPQNEKSKEGKEPMLMVSRDTAQGNSQVQPASAENLASKPADCRPESNEAPISEDDSENIYDWESKKISAGDQQSSKE